MNGVEIRKVLVRSRRVFHEGGPVSADPLRRGAVLAVVRNPLRGRFVAEIADWMEALKPLGITMAQRLLAALGGMPAQRGGVWQRARSWASGELEHGALWHAPGGYAMRDVLGGRQGDRALGQERSGDWVRAGCPDTT
jgi:hypothetical protein